MQAQQENPIVPTSEILTDEKPNFFIQQFYTKCIAEAAYYIESEGKAVIIDPLRDTYPYVQLARERKAKITHILLTHFHADFVSGHIDLQKSEGAEIVYGPTAVPNFKAYIAKDQEKIQIGKIQIQVLHTPGHTMESSTFLLLDEDKPYCIFTGDTLFLGEVGRPDLAVKGAELTQEDLAGYLFDSLNNVIRPLPDSVIVYPGHGAGSACGKNIQQGTSDTLGNQKNTNYAMKLTDKQEFIKTLTANLPTPPNYFFHDVGLNKNGYESLDELVKKNKTPLDVQTFEKLIKEGHSIIDSRDKHEYLKGFVKGSISIDLKAAFASWAGKLMKATDKFVLITPEGEEYQTIVRMLRVGYDNCSGYLQGGFEAWKNAKLEYGQAEAVDSAEFEKIYENKGENDFFLDVRDAGEKSKGDLAKFDQQVGLWGMHAAFNNDKDAVKGRGKKIYCVCQSGQRSVPVVSILTSHGYTNLVHVTGGMNGIKETKIPVTYP